MLDELQFHMGNAKCGIPLQRAKARYPKSIGLYWFLLSLLATYTCEVYK